MILERHAQAFAEVFFLEAAKVQRIVFAIRADVVDEQVVLGNLVAVFGVVPKPTRVRDQFASVVDEDVIDGNDAVGMVLGGRVLLQQVEASLIDFLDIPVGVGKKAIEAGLVGGLGKLAVDARD